MAPVDSTLTTRSAGRTGAAIGDDVTRFRVGEEVFGDNVSLKGGFAQYAVAPESTLARKLPS